MREVEGTVIGRWYVTVLGIVFFACAVRHLGWRRTLIYAVPAVLVGALFENTSVHWGVPYTRYAFNNGLRGKELFIGDVPLMVPLSYAYMGYFAFAAGRLLASGPRRTRGLRVWHEALLGVVLMVWAVWLFDPVARLGHRWFLGTLFHYAGPGFWFGLPLGSQLGFTLTAVLLVGLLTWLGRDDAVRTVNGLRHHPHMTALLAYHGQVIWLAVVAVWLGASTLGGSALLMWVPAAVVTAVHWSSERRSAPAATPAPREEETPDPVAASERALA